VSPTVERVRRDEGRFEQFEYARVVSLLQFGFTDGDSVSYGRPRLDPLTERGRDLGGGARSDVVIRSSRSDILFGRFLSDIVFG
jgi:hypothetical protein